METAGQKPVLLLQGRLQLPGPAGWSAEPDASRLAHELSDFVWLDLSINRVDPLMQLHAGAPAQVFQTRREARFGGALHAVEEVHPALRAAGGGQRFEACQERRDADAASDPHLFFAGLAKIKAPIRSFQRDFVAEFLAAFWSIVNWNKVNDLFAAAKG